jgi:hypothetical protein
LRCRDKLLPDLIAKDKTQVILKTNLISLALSEEEARKLFDGFSSSNDKNVQEVGNLGKEGLNSQREKARDAASHEAAAFEALISGDYQKAITEFEATDRVYPTFHQAYEISRLLRQSKDAMTDSAVRKTVLKRIVSELSWGASPTQIKKLNDLSK